MQTRVNLINYYHLLLNSGSKQGYRELWQRSIYAGDKLTGGNTGIWFNVNDYYGTSGSGPVNYYRHAFITDSGIGAGTYSLQNLLQQLVNKSHTHRTWLRKELDNCDCCSGDSDGS